MAICRSVIAGASEEATERTMALACTWSSCRAIVRTPSRAAAERVPCTWKARPNSAMPMTRTISSGRMRANSTALAPRCSRSRCCIVVLPPWSCPLPGPDVHRRSGPTGTGRCAGMDGSGGGRSGTAGQLGADQLEQAVELVAEDHDGGDDHDRDQADHEAVLDGGRALLLALEAVLSEGGEGEEGGVGLVHGCSWGVVAGQAGSGDPPSRLGSESRQRFRRAEASSSLRGTAASRPGCRLQATSRCVIDRGHAVLRGAASPR